jgi:hypothetical protein
LLPLPLLPLLLLLLLLGLSSPGCQLKLLFVVVAAAFRVRLLGVCVWAFAVLLVGLGL